MNRLEHFFKKNGPSPASFSFNLRLFKQTSAQFVQQIYVKKIHPWRWDLNPQPSEHESPPVTTRPGSRPSTRILPITAEKLHDGNLLLAKEP